MARAEPADPSRSPAALDGALLAPYQARVALDWLASDPESRWRTVEGTLVFGDVSGFTPLTERLARLGKVGAEELTDILNQVFGRLLTVADEAGGDLLKFGGDALLLLFTGPDHAARAAGCAMDLLAALRPFRRFRAGGGWVRLTMSVGLESGPVHLLLVGGAHRELFAVGPVVSATVGLEAAAEGGEVLVGLAAAAALHPSLLAESSSAMRLVGRLAVSPGTRPAAPVDAAALGLPAVLREHLAGGREDGEHRVASLAFLQFRGTDDLLARDGVARVAAEVERVVTTAQTACTRHGVTFLATDVDVDGGKILFVAGAPRVGDHDEDRMLLALRESVAADTVLTVRAGANRGRAFAVDVGTDQRRTYAVMGDATNLAARVMGKAGPGEVLATRALIDKAKGEFELTPREPFQVKGKTQPVVAAVVGRTQGQRRTEDRRLPLVGRSSERAVLSRALEAARAGEGQVVEVIGEVGLGKSRLADELVAEAADYFVLRVEGGQYAAVTPYAALSRSFRILVGARPDDEDDVVAERLRATAAKVAPEALPWLPLLGPLLGVEIPDTPEVAALAPTFRRSARHLHTTQLLVRALHERTLILVEDAHWLDEATGELLDGLCDQVARRSWMLCVTRRPDTRGWWPRAEQCTAAVELAPLSDADSVRLLKLVAQDRPLPPSTRDALATRCAGNPLFLREMLDALGEGAAEADLALLPDTLEEVVGSGVDQLPRHDRELLRVAAVLGARIDATVLARITALSDDEVRRSLDRLGRFLQSDGDGTFRFAQTLVRDVAYEGLPFRRRRELHGRAGDMLLPRLSEHESTLDLLALHYRAAERHAQAWWYAREAAERARRNSAPVEAARYYRWALEAALHLPDLPASDRAEVGERLGDMLELDGRYDEAAAAFAAARRLRDLDALTVAGLLKKEGWVRERSGRYSSALGWYTRAQRALEELQGEEAARARAALTMSYGAARARQGRYADSVPHLERAAVEAERLGDLSTLAHCYYLLDWALTDLGRPDAGRYREKALPIYEELGDLVGQASVLNNLGIDAYYEGRWDLARQFYERSREVSHRSGNVVMDGTSLNNIGEILSDQGRLHEAEEVFREALALWRAVRFPVGLALCLSNLGRVASRDGRPDEAAHRYGEAREHFTRIGADAFLVEVDSREAERLVLAGHGEQALAVTADTVARAETLGGMPVVLAMLDRVAGLALAQTGDVAGATRRLHNSRDRATEAKADFELGLTLHEWSRVAALDGRREAELLAVSASTVLGPIGVQRVAEAPLPTASRATSG